jgi:hypothetical protein
VELIVVTIAIVALLTALAVVSVSRIVSWRSVAMIAVSTRSLKSCVAFIRYCERL